MVNDPGSDGFPEAMAAYRQLRQDGMNDSEARHEVCRRFPELTARLQAFFSASNPVTLDVEEIDGIYYYRGSVPFDQLELPEPDSRIADDFEWASNNPDLRRDYGGLVAAVCRRVVWGVGKNPREAMEEARKKPACPPDHQLLLVAICGLPASNEPPQ